MADRIARAARAERIRAEEALAGHMHICLSCNRQQKHLPEVTTPRCDLGTQLSEHVTLMRRQEELLAGDDSDWIQESLF